MNRQSGSVSLIVAVVFGILFVAAAVFGAWAFTERGTYKNDSDRLVAEAVDVAVQTAEVEKEAEFVEREKSPYKTYVGPETYGSISFDYPKTWSLYDNSGTSATGINLYGSPGVVPAVSNDGVYALRLELLSKNYDSELASWQRLVEKGDMTSIAFRPKNVDNVLGVRLEGSISKDKKGVVIIMPLRDKTIKLSTEATQFVGDFDILTETLNFVP